MNEEKYFILVFINLVTVSSDVFCVYDEKICTTLYEIWKFHARYLGEPNTVRNTHLILWKFGKYRGDII
jgi:hypothetical protein